MSVKNVPCTFLLSIECYCLLHLLLSCSPNLLCYYFCTSIMIFFFLHHIVLCLASQVFLHQAFGKFVIHRSLVELWLWMFLTVLFFVGVRMSRIKNVSLFVARFGYRVVLVVSLVNLLYAVINCTSYPCVQIANKNYFFPF